MAIHGFDQTMEEGNMMAVVLGLLIGFVGLIVLYAPFWVSAEHSEEERRTK